MDVHKNEYFIVIPVGNKQRDTMNTLKRILKRIFCRDKTHPIIDTVLANSLTYLGRDALNDLFEQVTRLENDYVNGILIEAGCALGGSAIVIATAKAKSRPFYVYDVFGMIPPPSEQDGKDIHERYKTIQSGKSKGIGKRKYYGYEENLIDKVIDNFRKHDVSIEANNVNLIKGLFQETICVKEAVALAHIDCDWYESVKICLQKIEPNLSSGGILVIDDYEHWSGCKIAVDEYFQDKREQYEFSHRSRLHIVRK